MQGAIGRTSGQGGRGGLSGRWPNVLLSAFPPRPPCPLARPFDFIPTSCSLASAGRRPLSARSKVPHVAKPAAPIPPEQSARPRVLVVDDDQGIRSMLHNLLSREGYEVTTAGSGEEGLKALGHDLFDLVLLDLELPGMGGIEVLGLTPVSSRTRSSSFSPDGARSRPRSRPSSSALSIISPNRPISRSSS